MTHGSLAEGSLDIGEACAIEVDLQLVGVTADGAVLDIVLL